MSAASPFVQLWIALRVASTPYGEPMRWQALFADLEAQLLASARLEEDAELAERSRAEWGRTALADRLRAHGQARLQLLLAGGHRVAGRCVDAAPEWVVLDDGAQVLVPLHAVAGVVGLSRLVAPAAGQVERRLGLRHALRALSRDRVGVRLLTAGGELTGTLDRVGADHVDLAQHPPGEVRRPGEVRGVLAVPFHALYAVRSA